jgi:hypothetical protein
MRDIKDIFSIKMRSEGTCDYMKHAALPVATPHHSLVWCVSAAACMSAAAPLTAQERTKTLF